MDPYTFDQISAKTEEDFDAAIAASKKRLKNIMMVTALIHSLDPSGIYTLQDPESDEYDRWNEDYENHDNFEDEIYND